MVLLGAPHLAVHRHSAELLPGASVRLPAGEPRMNYARAELRVRGTAQETDQLFAAARKSYAKLSARWLAGENDDEFTQTARAAVENNDLAGLRAALGAR
jgi:hypothetical protein